MIPDVIYLQWFDEDGEPTYEATWCDSRILATDIEYRRLPSVVGDTLPAPEPVGQAGLLDEL